jgi:hypothetical protein
MQILSFDKQSVNHLEKIFFLYLKTRKTMPGKKITAIIVLLEKICYNFLKKG